MCRAGVAMLRGRCVPVNSDRIDVRREPLVVRDGCAPERIPAGRWPSDDPLVRSEQFAVNEAIACLAPVPAEAASDGVFGVHAPPGTGVAEVFGDLVAAIVTERARRIADLPDPAAAFAPPLTWGVHTVAAPVRGAGGLRDRALGTRGECLRRTGPASTGPRAAAHRGALAGPRRPRRLLRLDGTPVQRRRRVGDARRPARRQRREPGLRRALVARRGPRHGRAVPGRRVDDRGAAAAEGQGGRLAGRRHLVQVRAGQGRIPGRRTNAGSRGTHVPVRSRAGLRGGVLPGRGGTGQARGAGGARARGPRRGDGGRGGVPGVARGSRRAPARPGRR